MEERRVTKIVDHECSLVAFSVDFHGTLSWKPALRIRKIIEGYFFKGYYPPKARTFIREKRSRENKATFF